MRVRLHGETRNDEDRWYRCPMAEIDPAVLQMIHLYWDARAEGVPLLPPPIDKWPGNTLRLSRLMREIAHHASQKDDDISSESQAMAAAELQRKQRAAEALAGRR